MTAARDAADLAAAEWIGAPDAGSTGAVRLFTHIDLNEPRSARVLATARGWYRVYINGADVTEGALVPRWTPLAHELEYQIYDIGAQLRTGRNTVSVLVGDGRFRGRNSVAGRRALYGDTLSALVRVDIDTADGPVVVRTDASWSSSAGSIVDADPRDGEFVDLRISDDAWLGRTDAHDARRAVVVDAYPGLLVPETVERVRPLEKLPAVAVHRARSGAFVADFGQNFAGIVEIDLPAAEGAEVQLIHSELLTADGEVDTTYVVKDPMFQRDRVILGSAPRTWRPSFTIHGFRYVAVSGLDDLAPQQIRGIPLTTGFAQRGEVRSSDSRLERLHENVRWSLISNFTDTATDCPTRERSGWTGDIQLFGATSTYLADTQAFLRRYAHNVALEQYDDGAVPMWIPSDGPPRNGFERWMQHHMASSTGWGDVAVLLPWTIYRYFGDEEILQRQWESARRWVDFLVQRAARRRGRARWFSRRLGAHDRYIIGDLHEFGEWLRPGDTMLDQVRSTLLPESDVATANFAHCARVLADIAGVLGRDADAAHYRSLSRDVAVAWQRAFVRGDRLWRDSQDSYVRALGLGLLAPSQRAAAVNRLVELIHDADDHLATGFLSTPSLLPVLADNGHAGLAMRLLMQSTNPSWLYQVEHGATTVWESWEGYHGDGRAKLSHNHYAFGAVVSWLYEGLAGLRLEEPGWRRFRVDPVVTGDLASFSVIADTPVGLIRSGWQIDGDVVTLDLDVPPGSEAVLPDGAIASPGAHSLRWAVEPAGHLTRRIP